MNKAIRSLKSAVTGEATNGHAPRSSRTRPHTGVYVDVENLRDDAQSIVKTLMDNWPSVAPATGVLNLYVRADFVELWRLWASSQFRGVQVVVKGVQHYSTHASKNSADIAIATDAISDWLSGKVDHLAVLSDDSDFIALYAAVRDLVQAKDPEAQQVPFLWVITDRNDTLSTTVQQYFPREAIYVVPVIEMPLSPLSPNGGMDMEDDEASGSDPAPFVVGSTQTQEMEGADLKTDMIAAIIQQVPVGQFRSIDCQQVIRKFWPEHPLATASGPHFGTEFLKLLWPLLEKRGARVANPGQAPRRYVMTEKMKQDLFG